MRKRSLRYKIFLIKKNITIKSRLLRNRKKRKHKITVNNIKQFKNKIFHKSDVSFRKQKRHKPKTVFCPANLSLIDNSETFIDFITRIQALLRKKTPIFVDMKNVSNISQDAIVVLLSVMHEFKKRGIDFNGNFPNSFYCRNLLEESGFIENLFSRKQVKYEVSNIKYLRKSENMANGIDAQNVIKYISEKIWKERRRCPGLYKLLIELMHNTHAHAMPQVAGGENWWLSVDYSLSKNKVSIIFFDYGVGIFNSLKNKEQNSKWYGSLDKLRNIFNTTNNADALKLIVNGDMHKTCTQQYFRGKGLPSTKLCVERNQISNLIILSNDALGYISADKYVKLNKSLNGTFIHLEIDKNNENLQWKTE